MNVTDYTIIAALAGNGGGGAGGGGVLEIPLYLDPTEEFFTPGKTWNELDNLLNDTNKVIFTWQCPNPDLYYPSFYGVMAIGHEDTDYFAVIYRAVTADDGLEIETEHPEDIIYFNALL